MSEPKGMTRGEALRIMAVGGIGLGLGGGLAYEILRRAGLHRVSETRAHLGTLVEITSVHSEPGTAREIVRTGFAEIARLEGLLSRHAEGTPMWRLNARGVLEAPPEELLDVLRRAAEVHRLSDGAFDPSVAPVLALHQRRLDAGGAAPTDTEIRSALERVGFQDVRVESDRIRLGRPGMALTLDGIAKGYVVDRAVAAVTASGADRVMIDAGGDIASGGRGVADDPWTIGVQDPHSPERMAGRVRLVGQAVATSGDYTQAFTEDRRDHHIIDPRTGRSPEHTSSVSVVCGTAMDADALSTALLVLGPEAGLELLDRVPGAEGLVIAKDGTRHASAGMGALG